MTSSILPGNQEPPAPDPDWYRIVRNETTTGASSADLYVYGTIGGSWWGDGVVASTFNKDLAELDVDTLNVYVHSNGGQVSEGIAILNGLRRHRAKVIVTIDGIAASAASFIAMAGDEIIAGRNSEIMIHDAWAVVAGNPADLFEYAEWLDKTSNNIASIYAERTGRGTRDTWREAMRAETWYDPDEALAAGLVDRIAGQDDAEDHSDATDALPLDLSAFAHAGRAAAPAPVIPAARADSGSARRLRTHEGAALPTALRAVAQLPGVQRATNPPAEPVETNTHPIEEGSEMSDALKQGLMKRLGIKPDAELDDDAVLAELDEALEERADEGSRGPAQLPEGVVAVDADTYQQLQQDAQAGREAREQQLVERRENLVDSAIQDGRIAPARRDHWLKSLAADPGSAEVLASLEKGTVPLAPKGYTGGVDEASDEDRLYTKTWGSQADTKES